MSIAKANKQNYKKDYIKYDFTCLHKLSVMHRSVTSGGPGGAKPPLENFSPLLEKCVGHSLKYWTLYKKCGHLSENSSLLLVT